MSISVNGESQVPPGFRFHPTEEELLQYYLRKKVASQKIDLDVIQDVDLNKLEPWDIQDKCRIGSTPQNDWYFFSHKDKKYPTGTRTNRATAVGFWKATGRDKVIYSNSKRIGMRKTLVFYKGRAPHGQKSDWIMHEYRLDEKNTISNSSAIVCNMMIGEATQEEGWVVCRVFKKKIICHKSMNYPTINTTTMNSCDEGTLEQMLQYLGTPFIRNNNLPNNDGDKRFMKLPNLQESSDSSSGRIQTLYQPINIAQVMENEISNHESIFHQPEVGVQDWATLDRLVASHLNGHKQEIYDDDHDELVQLLPGERSLSLSSAKPFGGINEDFDQNDCDIWSFAGSSNGQLCNLPNVDQHLERE